MYKTYNVVPGPLVEKTQPILCVVNIITLYHLTWARSGNGHE